MSNRFKVSKFKISRQLKNYKEYYWKINTKQIFLSFEFHENFMMSMKFVKNYEMLIILVFFCKLSECCVRFIFNHSNNKKVKV